MTLSKQVKTLITNTANNNPAPVLGRVTRNYTTTTLVDVETEDGELLQRVNKIGGRTVGSTAVVIFLDGDLNTPFAIVE